MNEYIEIYTENVDPDTGSTTKSVVAKVNAEQSDFAAGMIERLIQDTAEDPNVEVKVIKHKSHPDLSGSAEAFHFACVLQLGELAYDCLHTKKTKFGNDASLGSVIRTKYIDLKTHE